MELMSDTHPTMDDYQIRGLRDAPVWRRLELAGQMYESMKVLMLAGIQKRYPGSDQAEHHRLLADLILGAELAEKIYGPFEGEKFRMAIPEPIRVTLAVAKIFDSLNIPYFIGGSMATAAHGVARATLDVDLVAEIAESQAERLDKALGDEFFVDLEMVRSSIRNKISFNIIHKETMFKVDIFPSKNRPFDRSQFERREAYVLDQSRGQSVNIASPEDIILAKLEWYRLGGEVSDRQWRDVRSVVKLQGDSLDKKYLLKWASELGVADLLERLLQQKENKP